MKALGYYLKENIQTRERYRLSLRGNNDDYN